MLFRSHNETSHRVIEICKTLFPKTKIRFGGIYPTLAPKEAKKSKADEVFIGEFHGIKDKSINYHLLGYNPGYVLLKGTKGCPNNCSYCAVHKLEGHKFCFRNPDEVFKEIEQEYEKHNITEVGIWDSNLLINYKNYFGAILEKVKKKRLNLSFSAPEGLDYKIGRASCRERV